MTLVDKDLLLKTLNLFDYRGDSHFLNGIITAKDIIKDTETVEIVSCKDCTYYDADNFDGFCWFHNSMVNESDYCSKAKRKDDNEE